MCQINADKVLQNQMKDLHLNNDDKTCCKCHVEESVIVIGTSGKFCTKCFKAYYVHKFRASLGKNPVVRHGQSVALAFSGGLASASLLQLLRDGLDPTLPKRFKFSVCVIFICDSSTTQEQKQKVVEQVAAVDFECHVVQLEEILLYDYLGRKRNNRAAESDLQTTWQTICSLLRNDTIREEFLHRMRCRLLSIKGKELGIDHILLGESSSRLAVKTMQNVVLGRGASIHDESSFMGFEGYKEIGVGFLRPLKDISAKEIAIYNSLCKIKSIFISNISTLQDANSSIQNLTEQFLLNLSAGFPATETTVYRTANKIKNKPNDHKASMQTADTFCALCYCYLPLESDYENRSFDSKLSVDFGSLINKEALVLPLNNCNKFCYSCCTLLLECLS